MELEPVICFEIHAELDTRSKLFCDCPNRPGAEPNTCICPVCTGQPGVLPVLNKRALELCIKTGIALNCRINQKAIFARKNYFYPDLPKGYQISQYELPLCEDGYFEVPDKEGRRVAVGIKRVHLEEDAGKLVHSSKFFDEADYSMVDFNRAGVPLVEIVSDHLKNPITDLEMAKNYLDGIRQLLRYIGASQCQMEMGQMRADVNVSLRPKGSKGFGNRVEVKNMSSFRFILEAIEYEINRQKEIYQRGDQVLQETRLFDEVKKVTLPLRSKEDAPDYRYFPEPDLVPLDLERAYLDAIRMALPELPWLKVQRFINAYGLTREEASIITRDKGVSEYFEACARRYGNYKKIYSWIVKDLFRLIPRDMIHPERCPISPISLLELLRAVEKEDLTEALAREVLEECVKRRLSPKEIIEEKGLKVVSKEEELSALIKKAMEENPDAVHKVRAGHVQTLNFLVGQVMKGAQGKADPKKVRVLIEKAIKNYNGG